MTSVTNALLATAPQALTDRCNENGCKVGLSGIPSVRVVVHLESQNAPIQHNQPHCDYLIGYKNKGEPDNLIVLELKRSIRASDVVQQLQSGAIIAQRWLSQVPHIQFIPVAAGSAHRQELNELRKMQVRFRKQSEQVRLIRCGDLLTKALC